MIAKNEAIAKPVDKSVVQCKPVVTLSKQSKNTVKKLWDNYKVVSEIQKSDKLKIIVAVATRDGFRLLVLREYYYHTADKEWKPGRDGMTIPLKCPLYSRDPNVTIRRGVPVDMLSPAYGLTAALPGALKEAEAIELYDSNNAVYINKK